MKKTINIKSSKLLIESAIKVGDADYEKKLRKRVVDLQRAKNMATTAKQKAEANAPSFYAKLNELYLKYIESVKKIFEAASYFDTIAKTSRKIQPSKIAKAV